MKIAVVTGASSGMGREFVRQIGFFYRNLDEIWAFCTSCCGDFPGFKPHFGPESGCGAGSLPRMPRKTARAKK